MLRAPGIIPRNGSQGSNAVINPFAEGSNRGLTALSQNTIRTLTGREQSRYLIPVGSRPFVEKNWGREMAPIHFAFVLMDQEITFV
ncbi:MAG: hypothetical protein H6Q52_74 [Deltaproteobacteria bacterium]|nr:hypothetical protein [Deltaproteobacteria bacterium]